MHEAREQNSGTVALHITIDAVTRILFLSGNDAIILSLVTIS